LSNIPRLANLKLPPRRPGRQSIRESLADQEISIAEHIGSIVTEESFAGFGFTGINFQDTEVDGKLYFLASGSISSRVNFPAPPFSEPDSFRIDKAGLSFLEAAAFLNRNTTNAVDGEIINEVLNQPPAKGIEFEDEVRGRIVNETFDDIKNLTTQVQINNRHAFRMLDYLVNETTTIYCDEIRALLPTARKAQETARNAIVPDTVSVEQYRTELPIVTVRPREEEAPPVLSGRIIGYIIDKYEISPDRDAPVYTRAPIVIENPNARSAIDFQVKYGTTYSYSIRAVAAVDFPAFNEDTGQVLTVTSLVASRGTPRRTVECVERVAPPPPADFNVTWDFTEEAPRLAWGFPVNTQQDIKKFQVFRRRTINDPYQLIREFDFNDAEPRLPDLEEPEGRLVIRTPGDPRTVYLDRGFDKDSTWIYTICSIDAHGLTSAYTTQFEVRFDRFKNKIQKRVISGAGAPKAYPNLYLEQDLFIDTIKDSGHTHMKIVFNPELLELRNRRGTNLELLSTNQTGGRYRLQLINVDFQKQQELDLFIDDRRTERQRPVRQRSRLAVRRIPNQIRVRQAGSIGTGVADAGASDEDDIT
jgi:hypothetical protein